MVRAVLSVVVLALGFAQVAAAATAEAGNEQVRAKLLADTDALVPGSTATLGVHLRVIPHWHTYWANPGENGTATEVLPTGPAGYAFGAVQFPLPHEFKTDVGISYGYENDVLLMVPVSVPKDAKPGSTAELTVEVNWLACKTECIEGSAKLSLSLPVAAAAKPANAELFAKWKKQLPAESSPELKSVAQARSADGTPTPELAFTWNKAPKKVEWFPLATRAAMIEEVRTATSGDTTRVGYKVTVYKPEEIPQGKMAGVLVFEDDAGQRRGVTVAFDVPQKKTN
jgi:DsbC/DsbD-like thiol-disulfide interchange protein